MNFESLIKKMTHAAVQGNGAMVADCFTADGVYHDVFYGNFTGQDIAQMIEDYFHRDGENFRWDIFEPVEQRNMGYARYVFSCLLYTSPSPRDATLSRMPSSA